MSPNRFGLPPPSPSPEKEEARAKLRAAVTARLAKAFADVVDHHGLDDARRVFDQISSGKKRKRGRPPKQELSRDDAGILLNWEVIEDEPTKIRKMARFYYALYPERYKNIQPESLERKMRMRVKELKEGKLIRDGKKYKIVPRSRGN